MLQHFGHLKARPESTRTKRPVFRIRTYQHEHRKCDEQNGPVSSPRDSCCKQCEHANGKNEQPRPVMVVFGPCNISGQWWSKGLTRDEGLQAARIGLRKRCWRRKLV